jgi:hypothetical protein
MRAKALTLAWFAAGLAAVLGCHHDKYKLAAPQVEEYKLPPDEDRYNNPPTEQYKPPPAKKDDTSLLGGGRNKMGGAGGPGRGFPGGF